MSSDQVERELKLGAWPEFVLPELDGAIDNVKPGPPRQRELDAIYYDTRDLHLLRRGATLRFRRGEPPGDVWTAKLPSDASTSGLARREITVTGRRETIPEQFADLTRGWALGQRLVPVARVHTVRVSLPLCDRCGRMLAMLDDDSVTVTRGRRVVARFRELEVELANGAAPELMAAVDERLRAAGAEKVPQIPKLSRALGRAATLPWQLQVPQLGSKSTMAAAAHAQLLACLGGLVDLHPLVVLDVAGSSERARHAARALRSALATFAPLFDPPLPAKISEGLDRVEAELAAVAELDALHERLRPPGTQAALGRAGARSLLERAGAARSRARGRALRALRGRPYTDALQALARSADAAPPPSTPGSRRVASAANKFVRMAWRALRDEHAVAQAPIERLRSALQLACAVPNSDASSALEQLDRLIAAARERDQAHALVARLRRLSAGADPPEAWAAGVIAGLERARAGAATLEFGREWDELALKGAWSWTD